MKLNLSCDIFGCSGYAVHSRNLAKALVKLDVDLAVECFNFAPNWRNITPRELLPCMDKDNRYETNVMINLPPFWTLKEGDRVPFYGFCIFEGDKLPYGWSKVMNRDFVKGVLVPSNHVREACSVSGVTAPVHIVPHGYEPEIFNPNQEKLPLPADDSEKFSFLYVGGYKDGEKDRKGLDILLRAFCAEFKTHEKVILRTKINTAYCDPQQTVNHIYALNLPPKDTRPIIATLFTNPDGSNYTDKQMAQLYANHDVLVAPSKADAFNLPCLESLACGTPVIASSYSGQTDFVNEDNGWLIQSEGFIEATGERWLYEGVYWQKPSQKHLQELLRYCFDNQNSVRKKKDNALKSVKNYTWQESAKKLLKVVEKNV